MLLNSPARFETAVTPAVGLDEDSRRRGARRCVLCSPARIAVLVCSRGRWERQ
jgi:hypothetical protein